MTLAPMLFLATAALQQPKSIPDLLLRVRAAHAKLKGYSDEWVMRPESSHDPSSFLVMKRVFDRSRSWSSGSVGGHTLMVQGQDGVNEFAIVDSAKVYSVSKSAPDDSPPPKSSEAYFNLSF